MMKSAVTEKHAEEVVFHFPKHFSLHPHIHTYFFGCGCCPYLALVIKFLLKVSCGNHPFTRFYLDTVITPFTLYYNAVTLSFFYYF